MFIEYDCVRLLKPLEGESAPVGSMGVIVMIHYTPVTAYEVEFFDEAGNSLMTVTVGPDQIQKLEL
ncbi:MAG TPA: DUF4926 domain-containing protein [Phycisphaerae bacterium]|nr:DUF4926 domain-containing protein [Phycisphaerae bacterium]HRW55632.1 DUF4926 domain-containing protein [Phycisphaerae bacterium]